MQATERANIDLVNDPGDYAIEPAGGWVGYSDDAPLWEHMWFRCPCGCKGRYRLRLNKPAGASPPSWDFNRETVTLHPSVHIQYETRKGTISHWHGWLQNGQWVSC